MGFSRQEYWSGLPFPSPGDLPHPGIEPGSPAFQSDALTSEPPGKPTVQVRGLYKDSGRHGGGQIQSTTWCFVQLLSRVQLFATPWTAARQASLSFIISQSLLKLMSSFSFKHPLLFLFLPSLFPPLVMPIRHASLAPEQMVRCLSSSLQPI